MRWNGIRYYTLPDFSAATGQELHGLNVAPGFANGADGDYSLAPGSDLIDAGIVIPGINDQGPYAYVGLAPDIGAYEYSVCALAQDVNGDGQVDVIDIQLVAAAWGQSPVPGYADRDGDGDVDIWDITQVAALWGSGCE